MDRVERMSYARGTLVRSYDMVLTLGLTAFEWSLSDI